MYQYDQYDQSIVDARVEEFRDQVKRRLSGELTEDEFKILRLQNGVYLQLHAYMLRVAIPYGTLSSRQMHKLADIARTFRIDLGDVGPGQRLRAIEQAVRTCSEGRALPAAVGVAVAGVGVLAALLAHRLVPGVGTLTWAVLLGAGGVDGSITLIDESYNANPLSMAAGFRTLGARPADGRRIVVLTDMLELGEQSRDLHEGLAGPIDAAGLDLVHAAGPQMRWLHEALPVSRRGLWRETAAELAAEAAMLLTLGAHA